MKKKKLIFVGLASLFVLIFLIFISSTFFPNSKISEKISPIQIITISDENSSITITKNNLDKTASINMIIYMESSELKTDFMDLTEFMTQMSCGIMSMAFFDEEAIEEFNNVIKEWNEMEWTVEEDKKQEEVIPENNILEGYKFKKIKVEMRDKFSKQLISDCIITGKGEEGMEVNYY